MNDRPEIKLILLDELRPHNIRQDYGDVVALAGTFKKEENGPDIPLVVYKDGDGYDVLEGHRRLEAARQAGLLAVWAVVKPGPMPENIVERQLVLDLQHKPLEPLERARAMRQLMQTHGLSQQDLAGRLGRSEAYVCEMLGLLDLAEPVQEALAERRISKSQARSLLSLSEEDQAGVLPEIEGKTVAASNRIIARLTETEEEHQAREDARLAESIKRMHDATPDPFENDSFDEFLAQGETAHAVSVFSYVAQARAALLEAVEEKERDALRKAGTELKKRVNRLATEIIGLATTIEETSR